MDAENWTNKLANIRRELDENGFTGELKKRLVQAVGVNLDPSSVNEELLSGLLHEAMAQSLRVSVRHWHQEYGHTSPL